MRAKILTARDSPWQEWIIVSRWGSGGEHLSISRTRVSAAPGVAPIQLAPRQTALAGLLRLPADGVPATFLLVQAVPGSISIAGDFTPAEGFVQLRGHGKGLRLRSEGRCVGRAIRMAWRVEAMRCPWIGEFIENGAAGP